MTVVSALGSHCQYMLGAAIHVIDYLQVDIIQEDLTVLMEFYLINP